jgi:polysaccharide pyruvyl transferase WcaK-like protein
MMMSPADAPLHDEFFDAYNKQIGMAPAARHARIPISWQSLSALSAVAGIVIGMRLHALILAAAHCVPAVALAYDPKVAAFMESTGQSDAVYDIRDNDTSKLAKLIERVWREREERGRALSAQLPELRRLAMRNGELAMNLMS